MNKLRENETTITHDLTGFAIFLEQKNTLGSLQFYQEAQAFSGLICSQKELMARSQVIYNRYLEQGVVDEVNLPQVDSGRAALKTALKSPDVEMFDTLIEAAYEQMLHDLFPRFKEAVAVSRTKKQARSTITAETSLSTVLNSSIECHLFADFCRAEHSEENLLFWLEVDGFEALSDENDMLTQGARIYHNFLHADAPLQIAISQATADEIKARLEGPYEDRRPLNDLFKGAKTQVYDQLALGMYPRYQEVMTEKAGLPSLRRSGQSEESVDPAELDYQDAKVKHVEDTLNDPDQSERLRAVADKSGNAEMVDFAKDCQEYSKLFNTRDRKGQGELIWEHYLCDAADRKVNIPDTQVKEIERSRTTDDWSSTTFEKAYAEVLRLLLTNCFKPYIQACKKEAAEAAEAAAVRPAQLSDVTVRPIPKRPSCCTLS